MKPVGPAKRQSGQSLVEFALSVTALLVLMLASLQLALIGNAALAVSQLAYAGARYAAINPSYNSAAVSTYMLSIAPSTINENSGADLTISVSPASVPRSFGSQLTVSVTYNLTSKLFLPTSFMGISFPTTLSNISNTMLSE